MDNNICDAWLLASDLHRDQRRKYTGNHYIDHLAEVAALTHIFTDGDKDAIIAAWLHDCVEDQDYPLDLIEVEFGPVAAAFVKALTELRPEGFNRKMRHALYNKQLDDACKAVQCVKAADIISNVKSVVEYDIKFAEVYIQEKWDTLNHLTKLDTNVRLAVKTCLKNSQRIIDERRLQLKLQDMENKNE